MTSSSSAISVSTEASGKRDRDNERRPEARAVGLPVHRAGVAGLE